MEKRCASKGRRETRNGWIKATDPQSELVNPLDFSVSDEFLSQVLPHRPDLLWTEFLGSVICTIREFGRMSNRKK